LIAADQPRDGDQVLDRMSAAERAQFVWQIQAEHGEHFVQPSSIEAETPGTVIEPTSQVS